MKKIAFLYIAAMLFAAPFVGFAEEETTVDLGKEDLSNAVEDIDNLASEVTSLVPSSFSVFLDKLDQFRVEKLDYFTLKRDALNATTTDELDIGQVDLNEEGNIEISTGIEEVKEKPFDFALVAVYSLLIFILSSSALFYAALVLVILFALKLVFGKMFGG